MDIRKLPKRRFNIDFYNQWRDLVGRYNWYEFSLIRLSGEYSPYKGSAEIELGLLGFIVVVTYIYDFSFTNGINSRSSQIRESLKAASGASEVVDPHNLLSELDRD